MEMNQDSIDARRWRAIKQRHAVVLCRLATGSAAYSSEKAPALIDAWADMVAIQVEAHDQELWRAEINERAVEQKKEMMDE